MLRQHIQSLQDRWFHHHLLIRTLVLTGVLALLGWLTVRPVYQSVKAWRMKRNLAAAHEAVAAERMNEARDLSLSVLRSGEASIEAYRILEKATAALRDPNHGDISRALLAHPQSTDEERLQCFRALATDVPMGLLGQTWDALPDGCKQDPQFATAFADRLLGEHRLEEAGAVLVAVPGTPRPSTVELRLIRVLIDSVKDQGYGQAQQIIADKMPQSGPDLAGWIDLLEQIPPLQLRPDLLDRVRRVLENPPQGSEGRMALLLARLDYVAHFSRAAAILDAAVATWQDRDPQSLANFLANLGLYQRLREVFPPSSLAQHPELLPRLLEAIERSGDWEQVGPLLLAHRTHLPTFVTLAHEALAAAKLRDTAASFAAWSAAMADAKASPVPTAYLTIQRIARDGGMPDEAEQALVAAIRLGRGPLPLYAELKPLVNSLVRHDRDRTLLEIYASYFAFEPGNPVLLTQFAYLACLNEAIDPKTLLKAMETLAAGFPNELPVHCVLATAYLCDAQPDKAAATLDRLQLDPDQLAPGYHAVFLTTQALASRIPKDDPRITDFPWKSLLPCERRKFNKLLRGAGAQGKTQDAKTQDPREE